MFDWITRNIDTWQRGLVNVRFAPKATEMLRCRKASLCAKTGPSASQQRVSLFDHLVGGSKQRHWDLETERLGSFEVNGKLEFGWLFYRQITWLGAL